MLNATMKHGSWANTAHLFFHKLELLESILISSYDILLPVKNPVFSVDDTAHTLATNPAHLVTYNLGVLDVWLYFWHRYNYPKSSFWIVQVDISSL